MEIISYHCDMCKEKIESGFVFRGNVYIIEKGSNVGGIIGGTLNGTNNNNIHDSHLCKKCAIEIMDKPTAHNVTLFKKEIL